ncbi:MAG: efflux RND transporter permease subunit [Sphaerochaetaceae bacterium]|nr:efflux RND transporter permease subunit [Sphaerochaetaceae bacterium]
MKKIIQYVENNYKVFLTIILLITIGFGFSLRNITIDTDTSKILPPNEELQALKTSILSDVESDYPKQYYFMLESNELFTEKTFNILDKVLSELSTYNELSQPFSLLDMVTIEKRGTRLAIVPISNHTPGELWTQEEVDAVKEKAISDDVINGLLLNKDFTNMVVTFSSRETDAQSETLDKEWGDIVRQLNEVGTVTTGGSSPLRSRLSKYLVGDLFLLLSLAFIVIIIIFYVSFKGKRAVLIPCSLTLIAIIWTLGTMTLLGYPLSLINLIIPCMVMILGSAYSIHVLTEYYKSYANFEKSDSQDINIHVVTAISKINKTIWLACLTTSIGFSSLLICQIEGFRQMGLTVTIGLVYCAILSLIYIPATLKTAKQPRETQLNAIRNGFLSKTIDKFSKYVVRRWYINILITVLIVIGFFLSKDHIATQTNFMKYFPKNDSLVADFKNYAIEYGSTVPLYIVLQAPKGSENYFLNPENLTTVHKYETTLMENCPDLVHDLSFSNYVSFMNKIYSGTEDIPRNKGFLLVLTRYIKLISNNMDNNSSLIDNLITEDGNQVVLRITYYDSVQMDQPTLEAAERIEKVMDENRSILPDDITIQYWSDATNGLHLTKVMNEDQRKSTILSFVLVFLILIFLFKSVINSIYTILPVLIGIMSNYIFMYILRIPFDVVTSMFVTVTVGIGVDDAIHYMLRYVNIKKKYNKLHMTGIVRLTLKETGRPIILTSVSIISGMLVLVFARYSPIKYFGILLAIALFNTTISTLIILPSTMIMVDKIKRKLKKIT